jgi:molybdopterin molybdotransferase
MPAKTGLLAAGGISLVRVHPLPRIGIIAIGDEVVKPGESLKEGQLYASNIVTLVSWLKHFRMTSKQRRSLEKRKGSDRKNVPRDGRRNSFSSCQNGPG